MFLDWLNLVFPPKKYFIAGSLLGGFLLPLITWSVICLPLSKPVLMIVCIILALLLLGCVVVARILPASRNKDLGMGWFSIGFILAGLTLPLLPVPKGIWTPAQSRYMIMDGVILLLFSMGYGLYRCFHHN
ncbi:hypothetical protein D1646_02030 [Pseudoflavonifractor sp. 60]|uniref:hypothetical protein n=1 Tax=Pseudoflavonifractor sp. 60 TaxID=2304576 RepID=UPI00136B4B98|nr:hypothetical protein [Pseudoflavonifractor sp. 60]NBI65605.1 hypothetical protein [Pseudoflavonifractor sp. 60]